MKKPIFTGVCTALVTPFINNYINYPMLEQLIKRQFENGIRSIVLSGTTGESPTLSDNEKIQMIQCAKSYIGDKCKIIAGTGSNSTNHALELSIAAQEAGADGLLIVNPYYNKGNIDGIYKHYELISQSVQIPIIIYNVPSRTGYDIPISLYKDLCTLENINGVKESSTDIKKITAIHSLCPDDFYIWSGNDDYVVPVISLGGKGVISVTSNLCPNIMLQMTQSALEGDFDSASKIQSRILRLSEHIFSEVNPIPIKYAMKQSGYDCGPCRLPLGQLSEIQTSQFNRFWELYNLCYY